MEDEVKASMLGSTIPYLQGKALTLAVIFAVVLLAGVGAAHAQLQNACSCSDDFECKATGRGDYCSYVGSCWGGNGCDCIIKPDVRIPTVPPFDQQFPHGILICAGPAGQPRCDGVCTSERRIGANYKQITPGKIAEVTGLLLDAYIESGSQNGGPPNTEILSQARTAAMDLPLDWQRQILEAVHDTLLVVLGGDVIAPFGDQSFAQVPKLSPEQLQLLRSVRDAIVMGIASGDPNTVVAPILDFWSANEIEPLHPDHCYPHGHGQAQSVEDCMIGQLTGMLTVMVRGQDETCDPSSPDCVGGEPPTCDPEQEDCGGGEPPACDPETQDCGGGEPPACDPATQDCGDGKPQGDPVPGVESGRGGSQQLPEGRKTRRLPWTRDPGGRSRSDT